MTNPNESIFRTESTVTNGLLKYGSAGLSKREYFAAMAMQGMIPNYKTERTEEGDHALCIFGCQIGRRLDSRPEQRDDRPMNNLTNLGWINARGETEREIKKALANCPHSPREFKEGGYGTIHRYECRECGWCYMEDSGD